MKTKKQNQEKAGRWMEYIACILLMLRGFFIVARRFKPPHRQWGAGEIDIIAKRGNLFIFVEVKLRQKGMEEAIFSLTKKQQMRITQSANFFLAFRGNKKTTARFDAIFFSRWQWPVYIANAWSER